MKMDFSIFKSSSESVMNSFNKSIQGIERLNRMVLGNVMSNIIEIIIVSGIMYNFLGPKYFLNTILTYAIYIIATKKISNYRMKLLKDIHIAKENLENKSFNIIYNIDTIKYFQREVKEADNFEEMNKIVQVKNQKIISSLALLNTTQNFIITLGMTVNLCMGIFDCYNSLMTPGDIVMMQAIFMQIVMPLNFMGMLMREIDETKVNLKYAINMVNEKEKIDKTKLILPDFVYKSGKIVFNDVHFAYDEVKGTKQKHILNGLSAEFQPGTMNAIVGFSGQGKSTLFNLIYKLYTPSQGQVIVDDQDLTTVNIDSYRQVKIINLAFSI